MKVLKIKNHGKITVVTPAGLKEVYRTSFFMEDGKRYNSDCPANIDFANNPARERMDFDRNYLESVGVSHVDFDEMLGKLIEAGRKPKTNGRLHHGS